MSPDVLNFLAVILARQSVSAADPNFDTAAALVSKARRELLVELEAARPDALSGSDIEGADAG